MVSNDGDHRAGYDGLKRPANGDWNSFRQGQQQRAHDEHFRKLLQDQHESAFSGQSSAGNSGANGAGAALGALIVHIADLYDRLPPEKKAAVRRGIYIAIAGVVGLILAWMLFLQFNTFMKDRQKAARQATLAVREAQDDLLRLPEGEFIQLASSVFDPSTAQKSGSPSRARFDDVSFKGEAVLKGRPVRFELTVDLLRDGQLPSFRRKFPAQQAACRFGRIHAAPADYDDAPNFQAYHGAICTDRVREVMDTYLPKPTR